MTRKHRTIRQHELGFRTWGGARKGAGRKRSSSRSRVPHAARAAYDAIVRATSDAMAGRVDAFTDLADH